MSEKRARVRVLLGVACGVVVILALGACKSSAGQDSATPPIRAVYLVPQGVSHLSAADLAEHPDVKVVTSWESLAEAVTTGAAVWIDRDAVDQVDITDLRARYTGGSTVALVGHGGADMILLHKMTADNHARVLDTPQVQGFCLIRGDAQRTLEATPTVDALLEAMGDL